jgi:hypothetical protein
LGSATYPEEVFFWIGLAVVLVVFVAAVAWGSRGMKDREHEPGTTYMDKPEDRLHE